jgi:hypothetical protein
MPFTVSSNVIGSFIVRAADNAFIPEDLANKDYQDYLAWVAAGSPADWTTK